MTGYLKIQNPSAGPRPFRFFVKCSSGFTLLETLVAFMVLSIVLVVILQTFSGGIRSGHKSGQYIHATFHARAKMEELMVSDVSAGRYQGAWDDGYKWQAVVARMDPEEAEPADTGMARMTLTVKVSWEERGQRSAIELHSLKLVSRDG